MTTDRERMLAEGPRLAPEPASAPISVDGAQAPAVPPVGPPERSADGNPRRSRRRILLRAIPLGVFAAATIARNVGGGYAWVPVVLLVAAGVLFAVLRRKAKR